MYQQRFEHCGYFLHDKRRRVATNCLLTCLQGCFMPSSGSSLSASFGRALKALATLLRSFNTQGFTRPIGLLTCLTQ